jgi:hypothetical protein
MSIGRGVFSPGDDPEQILAIADRDMYRMKCGQNGLPRQRDSNAALVSSPSRSD